MFFLQRSIRSDLSGSLLLSSVRNWTILEKSAEVKNVWPSSEECEKELIKIQTAID
jgi:hypothetical protein